MIIAPMVLFSRPHQKHCILMVILIHVAQVLAQRRQLLRPGVAFLHVVVGGAPILLAERGRVGAGGRDGGDDQESVREQHAWILRRLRVPAGSVLCAPPPRDDHREAGQQPQP